MLARYVAMDLETTGLDPARDRIIEIGLVKVENGRITDTFQSLIRPHCRLPVKIKRLTGLDDALLATAPDISEILPLVAKFIEGENLLGHNIEFDFRFLEAAMGCPLFNPVYDTLELSRYLLPTAAGYRLSDLCGNLGITVEGCHRAYQDAMAASELYQRLVKILEELDGKTMAFFAALLSRTGSRWGSLVGSVATGSAWHKTSFTRSSSVANRIAAHYRTQIGEEGYVDPDRAAEYLGPNSILNQALPDYEVRTQQMDMAREVARAFNENRLLLVEAGTGTGKSMAYLVPAILWAASGGPRVVVSTRTINLQEQLLGKDIPLLLKSLKPRIEVALAKGRQNYICWRKWQGIITERSWLPREASFYAKILVWLTTTLQGDRVELNLTGPEQEFWLLICGDSDSCLGPRCRWHAGDCFVARARRKAEAANLIITNHALLFADIKADNRVIPTYGPLIIDEAHHLEDAATEQLGSAVSRVVVGRWLSGVGKAITRLWDVAPPAQDHRWREILARCREERISTRQAAELFFNLLYAACAPGEFVDGLKASRRLTRDMLYAGTYSLPLAEHSNLLLRLRSLRDILQQIYDLLLSWAAFDDVWESRAADFEYLCKVGEDLIGDIEFNFSCEHENFVYWVEVSGEGEAAFCTLHSAPVRVGELIYKSLFKDKGPVVMTSATLSVNYSFEYYVDRAGLGLVDRDRLMIKQVESPFEYEKQSLLCAVRGLPGQGERPDEDYIKMLVQIVKDFVAVTGGRTLILFTSHRVLRETYHKLKPLLEELDICLLGHNIDGGRFRLVEEFKKTERAVLLGAASFWEGVDIPGEALSCVIIVKLPFVAPSVPVIESRMEEIERKGGNSFYNFSLPQAVIRFKQGFGRLIRNEKDRGAVIILDNRVLEKRYGRHFFASLPVKNHFRGNPAEVLRELGLWLKGSDAYN